MPIGAGLCPAGLAAAGYGVVDTGTAPLNALLPDVRTGLPRTGRAIDTVKKDYVMQSDGRLQGFDTVPQLVQLALSTALGSSAIQNLGIDWTKAQEKGSDFQRQLATIVANALAPLVAQKLVEVRAVIVSEPPSNPDAGVGFVKWFDMTSQTETNTTIGP